MERCHPKMETKPKVVVPSLATTVNWCSKSKKVSCINLKMNKSTCRSNWKLRKCSDWFWKKKIVNMSVYLVIMQTSFLKALLLWILTENQRHLSCDLQKIRLTCYIFIWILNFKKVASFYKDEKGYLIAIGHTDTVIHALLLWNCS